MKAEFEYYGAVRKVRLVKNKKTNKSRGYAFVEFEHSADLKEAYKDADGRKIHGRRICVDVERGRTVKNWKPRRLGGGLGATRLGGKDVNQKWSGREPPKGSVPPSSSSSSGDGAGSYSSRRDDRRDDRRDERSGRGREDSRPERYSQS